MLMKKLKFVMLGLDVCKIINMYCLSFIMLIGCIFKLFLI